MKKRVIITIEIGLNSKSDFIDLKAPFCAKYGILMINLYAILVSDISLVFKNKYKDPWRILSNYT